MNRNSLKQKMMQSDLGFTLIELLVVIAIIALLAAFVVANFAGVRQRGRDIQRKNDLAQLKKSLRVYYNDFQAYPGANSNRIAGCDDGATPCDWGEPFSVGATVYMNQLPVDPINEGTYQYLYQQVSLDQFYVFARLENASDDDTTASQTRCGSPAMPTDMNYVVCTD